MEALLANSEQISLSGMRAAERKLEVSAHNTANASTDGFERLRTTARETASGVGASSDTVELSDDAKDLAEQVDGPQNNVDQVSETVDRIESSAQFATNARTLRTQDRLMKSLLDIFA
jgi:flagellar basal body rod protein FlgG